MKVAVFLPELLRHLFKKPATVDYPFKKLEVPKDFRGSPFLHPGLCIACRACERDCPAEAIEIRSVSEAEKKFEMVIHNDRCIHCAQCVDSCPVTPVKAMEMDHQFEIAGFDRHDLKMKWEFVRAVLKKEPKPAPPKPESSPQSEPAQS